MDRARFLMALAGLVACLAPGAGRGAEVAPAGSGDKPVLVSADELQYDQDLGLIVAKGHVELSQTDEVLLADMVTYNQRTDVVTASGNVSLLQPTGDVAFANFMELRDNFRDGFIKDVRMLLFDGSRLAGNTARRVGGTRTEVKRAVFSPCQLCAADPTRPPVWQIKAEDAVDDKDLLLVEYRDVVLELGGVPVFYSPYFSMPDPSVKRASGFLPPVFGNDSSNGFRFGIPYFLVLGPDKDMTFRPIFTTDGGTILNGEYRQRFGDGVLYDNTSLTFGSKSVNPRVPDVNATDNSIRGHIQVNGLWDLTPSWRAGIDSLATTDQTYLQRYHFPYPSNYLTDQAYAENFGPSSYANISAYAFQNLNTTYGIAREPIVLPVANYTWTTQPDAWGSRWQFNGNVLNLSSRDVVDERRVSAGANWRLPFNGPLGDRYVINAALRGDGYNSDFSTGYGTNSNIGAGVYPRATSKTEARAFPQLGLTWRYPWVRPGDISMLIEPVVAAFASPIGQNPITIPNEDSQSFEFDETDLFVPNRFAGYDRIDGGQRVDYGLHAGFFSRMTGSTQILVGQSYRFQSESQFPLGSGLDHKRSDIVGGATATPIPQLNVFYRGRFDSQDMAARRQEVGVSGGAANLNAGLTYIATSSIPGIPSVQPTSQIGLSLGFALTDNWTGQAVQTQNLNNGATSINSSLRLTYRDDCVAVTGIVQRSAISVGDVKPGLSFVLTFILRDLGDVTVTPYNTGG